SKALLKIIYCILVHTGEIPKDVVFLLDGSDESKNGFHAICDFVQKIVESLSVEEGKDRVSVVQYSGEPRAHFYLNTYKQKQEALNAIKVLEHKGGQMANIGAALEFVRHNVFTSSLGSGRLQILILLSSTSSSDVVKGPAMALKDLEVISMSIGVETADLNELNRISLQPSFTYTVSSFDDLSKIEPQVISSLKAVSLEYIPDTVKPEIVGKNFHIYVKFMN
ncbi:collagen alpha-3(VI) chain-like, partial [Brachyhypopomus gauderio]|uniref:collagen alpha-3(VI) chain-like n=1 Tax=Brachyhypopomus gauderio TaxID=698409 RepID=UPI004041369C